MDRETLLNDLRQARACAEDAARHIQCMILRLDQGDDMPKLERAHAAEKLNRASEGVRRTHDD